MSDKSIDGSADYLLLTRLADEFAARYRAGERPSLQEYVDRHPALADEIRELFPTMVEMEQVREDNIEQAEDRDAAPALRLKQLGDFRILREVGKGGMGVVYEAEQVSLGRHVALKVLPHAALLDPKAKRRFEREARSAAKLHHTNIVPVFGVGEQDGMPYYVMQFIQGLGLDGVLDELKKLKIANVETGTFIVEPRSSKTAAASPNGGPAREISAADVARSLFTGDFAETIAQDATPGRAELGEDRHEKPVTSSSIADSFHLSSSSVVLPGPGPDGSISRRRKRTYWQSVASIGRQVARALEYAHRQGIQHRDIKPSNLLLDTQGTVWVADFGLAKADDQQDLTHTGDILGTLRYMPPEGLEGKADARGDVYSLGLTLYELLALRPAFDEKERRRLIKQVTDEAPARLGKLNRQVPRDLETIVHKAIEKDPKQRYASASEMADDLERFLEDEPITARRVSAVERIAHFARRNPLVAGLAAAMIVVLTVTAIGASVAAVQLAASAEESRARLVRLSVDKGMRLVDSGDNLSALPWLAEALRRDSADPAREEIHRLRLGAVLRQAPRLGYLWPHEGAVYYGDWSPDGRLVATASTDRTVRIWDASTGALLKTMKHDKFFGFVLFDPTGRSLMAISGRDFSARLEFELRVWDVATGALKFPAIPLDEKFSTMVVPQFTPDGRAILISLRDTSAQYYRGAGVRLIDAATGRDLPGPWRGLNDVTFATYSPVGGRVAVGRNGPTVDIVDVDSEKIVATLVHEKMVTHASYSGDGKRLATIAIDPRSLGDSEDHLWDAATGKPALAPVKTLEGRPILLELNHDGRRMIQASVEGGSRIVRRLWDMTVGRPIRDLREGRQEVNGAWFSRDGSRIVGTIQDGGAGLWDATTGELLAMVPHPGPMYWAGFSPDGDRLVTAGIQRAARLWHLAPSVPEAPAWTEGSSVSALAISPDGSRAAVGTDYGNVILRDLATGERVLAPFVHGASVRALAWSPDGRLLATGSVNKTAQIWDGQTGAPKGSRLAHADSLIHVIFSPDGRRLVTTTGRYGSAIGPTSNGGKRAEARVYDVATGELVATLPHEDTVCFATFSPDSRLVATASCDKSACTWEAKTGKRLRKWTHPSWVAHVAFSPDGKRLVTSVCDPELDPCSAYLWDVETGERVAPPLAHNDGVVSAEFSPDGRRVLTAGEDAMARVWDARTGKPLTPPMLHTFIVTVATFSPSGQAVFTSSLDGTARVWDAATGEAITPLLMQGKPAWVYRRKAACNFAARRVVAANHSASVQVWDMPLDRHTTEDAARLAEVLSGRRLDDTGGLVSSETSEIMTIFKQLSSAYPTDFTCTPAEVAAWYRQRAQVYADRKDDAEALRCLDKIVALDAARPADWIERAKAHERGKQWEEAAGDYAKAAATGSADPNVWLNKARAHRQVSQRAEAFEAIEKALGQNARDPWIEYERGKLFVESGEWEKAAAAFGKARRASRPSISVFTDEARTRLHQGDIEGYRQICADLVRDYGDATDAQTANNAAWACCLGPDGLADLTPAVGLSELAVKRVADHNNLNTLGAILFRSGNPEEAIKRLQEGIKKSPDGASMSDLVFLAMAHHRLGHSEVATGALKEATSQLGKRRTANSAPVRAEQILNELEDSVLLKEAQSMLRGTSREEN
jgi:WD40 repeat protein/serine/threonine protein kinase/tetratricopeptide (TPR) repeat protein